MRATRQTESRRMSSTVIGIVVHPHSCSRAVFSRSCNRASRPTCHSTLSYSATTIASGQAKSTRQILPCRSRMLYCSSGLGSPLSLKTIRVPLSIGDSVRPSAKASSSRTSTKPRRPDCARTAARKSAALQAPTCSVASSVARALGRRSARAISIAVHAGVVARRPFTCRSGAPIRWCTMSPGDGRIRTPGSRSCSRDVPSVSKPYNPAAVPMQATTGRPAMSCTAASAPHTSGSRDA